MTDGEGSPVFVTFFSLFDEHGVFGEPACIDEELFVILDAERLDSFCVFHADGLAAAGVVGNAEHDEGDMVSLGFEDFF